MRTRLSLLLALLLAASASATPVAPEGQTAPEVYAVVFTADWCGSCKILEPSLMPVQQSLAEDEAVTFVTFDMTNKATIAASEETAASLGLDAVYGENVGRTGFVLLVDAETGEVLDRIESRDDESEIQAKIQAAVVRAS